MKKTTIVKKAASPKQVAAKKKKPAPKLTPPPQERVKFPPIRMVSQLLPGTRHVGPFCRVKLPVERVKGRERSLPEVWVRVVSGDERNGRGIIIQSDNNPVFDRLVGVTVRFAGGTKEACAKALLNTPINLG